MAATPRYVPLQNETLYIMEEASLILFCFTWMVREFMLPLKNALLIKFFLFFQHACFFFYELNVFKIWILPLLMGVGIGKRDTLSCHLLSLQR